jgi:hypothetical protein
VTDHHQAIAVEDVAVSPGRVKQTIDARHFHESPPWKDATIFVAFWQDEIRYALRTMNRKWRP